MAASEQIFDVPVFLSPATEAGYREIYERNRHRIYALAFWMTDNELVAEELMQSVFRTAFSAMRDASPEAIDRFLIASLREMMPLGELSLSCAECHQVINARRNTLRVHLERAVVQLPPTERLIFLMHDVENYAHERIARALGISEEESITGLHQARLRLRELLAAMKS